VKYLNIFVFLRLLGNGKEISIEIVALCSERVFEFFAIEFLGLQAKSIFKMHKNS